MSCDAWKDTGDCEECRRKKYCREMCSARKRRLKSIIDARFIRSEKTGNLYPKLAHRKSLSETGTPDRTGAGSRET